MPRGQPCIPINIEPGVYELAGALVQQSGRTWMLGLISTGAGSAWHIEYPMILQRAYENQLDPKQVGLKLLETGLPDFWVDAVYSYTNEEFVEWISRWPLDKQGDSYPDKIPYWS